MSAAAQPLRVIVTRPEEEAHNWVEQLARAGFAAEALPLIAIRAAAQPDDIAALGKTRSELAQYAACLFVSGNAVRYFFKHFRLFDHAGRAQSAINNIATVASLPASLRLLAPGPGTAAALRDAGVPAAQIDTPAHDAEQFDSEALWQQIGRRDWAGQRVLIVRGRAGASSIDVKHSEPTAPGRDWIARQWLAAGARVDFLCVYERVRPELTAAQRGRAHAACTDGSVWLFSSSEAVANLATLTAFDFSRSLAIATHPRIAKAATVAGWGGVGQSRPALAELIACLRSMDAK